MDNLEIYNKYREVPKEAQKTITGGRINGFTDINSMWRIKCLTEQFGPCGIGWYIEVTDKQIESHGDETAVFVSINLYVKNDGEWSKPIYGNGGSKFVTKERSGVYVSDECFKMAVTDAISVACKMLGIGADIYWAEDRTKYGSADKPNTDNDKKAASSQAPKGRQTKEPSGINHAMGDTGGRDLPIGSMGDKYLNSLKAEMDKKFVTEDKILARYKVKSLGELTFKQYQDAMKGLEKTKPPINPPEDIPDDLDDPGLPWNQPSGDTEKAKKGRKQYNDLMDEVENGKFS